MTVSAETIGYCLCKKIKVRVQNIDKKVWACHCKMCRSWGGGPLLSVDCGDAPRFEGREHIAIYDSSVSAERGFCKNCGGHLYYRDKESGAYFIPVGCFDDAEGFELYVQQCTDKKPEYYYFSHITREMKSAEFWENF